MDGIVRYSWKIDFCSKPYSWNTKNGAKLNRNDKGVLLPASCSDNLQENGFEFYNGVLLDASCNWQKYFVRKISLKISQIKWFGYSCKSGSIYFFGLPHNGRFGSHRGKCTAITECQTQEGVCFDCIVKIEYCLACDNCEYEPILYKDCLIPPNTCVVLDSSHHYPIWCPSCRQCYPILYTAAIVSYERKRKVSG